MRESARKCEKLKAIERIQTMPKSTLKKITKDPDYELPRENILNTPKKGSKGVSKDFQTFLSRNRDEIIGLHKEGLRPAEIAETICMNRGLKKSTISAKQVSNWLDRQKKSKNLKTKPISLPNNNLRVNLADDQRCKQNIC
jgi:hypothetical protein